MIFCGLASCHQIHHHHQTTIFFGQYGTWNLIFKHRRFANVKLGVLFKIFRYWLQRLLWILIDVYYCFFKLIFMDFHPLFGRRSCQTFFCLKSITHSEKSARLRAENGMPCETCFVKNTCYIRRNS